MLLKERPQTALRIQPQKLFAEAQIDSIPAARRMATQCSMTVLLPKGSRGLKAPMRNERPAANSIAATSIHELIERFWSAPAERSGEGALDRFSTSLVVPTARTKNK